MCGNAIRCVAKLLYERGLDRSNPMTIETQSGDKILALTIEGEEVTAARVDMGLPRVLEVGKRVEEVVGSYISVGNPTLSTSLRATLMITILQRWGQR